jgi:hypothetical protein
MVNPLSQPETIPVRRFLDGAHIHQLNALAAFDRHEARFFSLEWHRRARKSTLACNLLIRESCRYPKRSYVYVGPTKEQARNILWDDPNMLFAYLPPQEVFGWEKNEQKLYIRFANGSILRIRGADDPGTLRGIDAAGIVFDEWPLMDETIWTGIFCPIMAQDPRRWAIFCWTPIGENHATDMHAAGANDPEWYVQTLKASESGLIPPDELVKAKKRMPPTLYDQEMECAHITDEERVLITSRMLDELNGYEVDDGDERGIISCDPSMGGDEAVFMAFRGRALVGMEAHHERDPMKLLGFLTIFGRKHGINTYVIDSIGIGGPLCARMSELGANVIPFNSSETSARPGFFNKRAEAWWAARDDIQDHKVDPVEDAETRRQLAGVRYGVADSSGLLRIELKDKAKKRIGRSPDRGDCYVMGRWAMPLAENPANTRKPTNTRYRRQRPSCAVGASY